MPTAAIHTRRGRGLTVLLAVVAAAVAMGVLGPVVALGAGAWRTPDRTNLRNPAIALLVVDRIVAKPTSLLNVDVSMMRGAAGCSICVREAAELPSAYRQVLAPMFTTGVATLWVVTASGVGSAGHVVEHFPRADRLILGDEEAAGLDAAEDAENSIGISEDDAPHIFRNSSGHFPDDTPESRAALTNTANNPDNYVGTDQWGKQWYTSTQGDGSQIWAWVENGQITNGGFNSSPWQNFGPGGLQP